MQMYTVTLTCNTLILISSLLCFVELKQLTASGKAIRNAHLDGIFKTENQLWDARQCSKTCCLTSCRRHIDCRSFAYSSNTKRCQIYNRDFRGQIVPSTTVVEGILHHDMVDDNCGMSGPFDNAPAADCAEVQAQGYTCNRVYTIMIHGVNKPVWCDLQTDGGRWTVVQRRKDGSENFDVGWNEYKDGFGVSSQEYWIGNDAMFALSNDKAVELMILMERWNGVWVHARYSTFRVNGESDKYRLTVSGYIGTAGDSLTANNGQQFSTVDVDNDLWVSSCNPAYHTGGWWYGACTNSALNGLYYNFPEKDSRSCHWNGITGETESLKTVFMMIRQN